MWDSYAHLSGCIFEEILDNIWKLGKVAEPGDESNDPEAVICEEGV